jgi:RNA polymerase sigma-70 factor (ECF subfamily)
MFREHWSLVVGYLAVRVRDLSLAEELAAETFYRATRAFLGWRGESAPAWLLAIARNVLVDAVRRDRRHVVLDDRALAPVEPLDDDVAVRVGLEKLPEQDRRLLVLVHVYGYSCPEVAAMSGSTPGAVRTALYRARNAAKEALS